MKAMMRPVVRAFAAGILLASMTMVPVVSVQASDTPNPSSVTIAGDLQNELGCAGDWDPTCATTDLTYDTTDGVWKASFLVPAGAWNYKAALNGSWDENYGRFGLRDGPNRVLVLAAPEWVKFYYDHETHWLTDNVSSQIATVAGSFQSELGCPADWQPDCLRSWLQNPDEGDIYTFTTTAIPAGEYQFKVAINEGWTENYGAGGVPDGPNVAFSVPTAGSTVTFSWNAATKTPIVTVQSGEPPGVNYTISGTMGDNGWYTGDVTVSWTVTDNGSPIMSTSGCGPTTIATDTTGVTLTCTATSGAGTASSAVTIHRDATGPVLAWTSPLPADGRGYDFGNVPADPTCTGADDTSGVTPAGCTVSGYGTAVGTHTLTATARDNAGNMTTDTRTYTVRPWTLRGFFDPVEMHGQWNRVRGGSTLPLKFEVFQGMHALTGTSVISTFTQQQVSCSTRAGIGDPLPLVSAGGVRLHHSRYFEQDWTTPQASGACYRVTMTTLDSSTLTAWFKLK